MYIYIYIYTHLSLSTNTKVTSVKGRFRAHPSLFIAPFFFSATNCEMRLSVRRYGNLCMYCWMYIMCMYIMWTY